MTDEDIAWGSPLVRAAVLDKHKHAVWNAGQLTEVLALAGVRAGCHVLDAGAGSGGMLELFADLLPHDARMICVDREPTLSAATLAKADALDLRARVTALTADVTTLPLPDASVDLAFCQTVLMHAASPGRVITELARVTRPGGAVVVVEGNAIIRPNLLARVDAETAADVLRLWHRIRNGRRALGRGDLAIGEAVPALLADAGLGLVAARLVDRVLVTGPAAPAAWRDEHRALLQRAAPVFAAWRPGFREAFVAAGGAEGEFDRLWQVWSDAEARQLADAQDGASAVLAGLLYVFVARR